MLPLLLTPLDVVIYLGAVDPLKVLLPQRRSACCHCLEGKFVCAYIHTYIHTHSHTPTHPHTDMHTHIHIYIQYTDIRTYTCTYVHVRTYTDPSICPTITCRTSITFRCFRPSLRPSSFSSTSHSSFGNLSKSVFNDRAKHANSVSD